MVVRQAKHEIRSQLVCGSFGTCLDYMLTGVQVAVLGWDFYLRSIEVSYNEDSDSLH